MMRCKFCIFGASVALVGLAAAATWAWVRNKEPPPAPPVTPVAPAHAKAPEVLATALERLHQEALAHFHADPKNGYARMPPVFEKVVKEWQTPWFSSGELDRDEVIPFSQDMKRIHDAALQDFLSPRTPDPNGAPQAYGIVWDEKKYDRTKKVWEAKSVDLIGLVKNPTPVVYVSDKIDEAKATGEAPTRVLDEFEFAGLQALAKGDDLFGRARDGVIRLLGAVRAEASCVSCHRQKKEGDLLGAFSYVVREAQYERRPWGSKSGTRK